MIRINHKTGQGPCLEIQTSESATPGDEYCKQIASFREREGIKNDIIIATEDCSGIRVDLDYLAPNMEGILRWFEADPPSEVANSPPVDIDEGSEISIDGDSQSLFVEKKHIEKHAREACTKYWARAPVNVNGSEQCRAYLSRKKGMPKAHEILYEVCRRKVMLECKYLARVSASYTADTLMAYLSSNHRNNYNRHVKDNVQNCLDADRRWYLDYGGHLINCIGKCLERLDRQTAEGGRNRFFSMEDMLEQLRPIVLQKLPGWYSPDKYSFLFTETRENLGNEINAIIVDDLHKVKEEHPEFDGRAKALMSEQIHKQALDRVKHVQEKYNELKRTMDRKDKLYEEGKAERDILKKQMAELQKEVEQLKSRRPGAKRGAKQRRTQECGNEYAKTYITGTSRRRRPLEDAQDKEN
eukprot:jgi/Picre1/31848/NNA_007197.t1